MWGRCLANPMYTNKGKESNMSYFFNKGELDKLRDDCKGKLQYSTVNSKECWNVVVQMIIIDKCPFKQADKPEF